MNGLPKRPGCSIPLITASGDCAVSIAKQVARLHPGTSPTKDCAPLVPFLVFLSVFFFFSFFILSVIFIVSFNNHLFIIKYFF